MGAVKGFNNTARITTKKAYGFRTYEHMEIALYHALQETRWGRLDARGEIHCVGSDERAGTVPPKRVSGALFLSVKVGSNNLKVPDVPNEDSASQSGPVAPTARRPVDKVSCSAKELPRIEHPPKQVLATTTAFSSKPAATNRAPTPDPPISVMGPVDIAPGPPCPLT